MEKEKTVKMESSSGSKHENVARDESIVEEINARVDEHCPLAIEEDCSVQHTNVHGSESECDTSHTSTAFNEERAESDDRDVS
ncbi:unnamed protein product [Anisakis simplex]|uniref:Uncharacterized protein n=1 Tax=Anisakis simplex TaxID=6269 RepID=A0A3P6PV62_ANISI|nr:unnamed protein product [Anisakis simplex]